MGIPGMLILSGMIWWSKSMKVIVINAAVKKERIKNPR